MSLMPIVLDIETSGRDFVKCGIWQIGAIDLNHQEEYFLQEARIDDEDKIEKGALAITGQTEEDLRDQNRQTQKQMLMSFFKWIQQRPMESLLCEGPDFDASFMKVKASKYELENHRQRSFDLHTQAQLKFYELYGKFLIKEGSSDMGLTNILKFCGLEDNRKEHNALEDCKLTGECFSRLLDGKNLFQEYSRYEIPGVLRK